MLTCKIINLSAVSGQLPARKNNWKKDCLHFNSGFLTDCYSQRCIGINDPVDELSDSAFMRAAQYGDIEYIKKHVSVKGLDINKTNIFGATALILAVINNKIGVVREILMNRDDVRIDIKDKNFHTAKEYAEMFNSDEIVDMLQQYHTKSK